MKMETDVSSTCAGVVSEVIVKEGDAVTVGQALLSVEPAHG
jgi:oxaloacetate decarboxylase alpha subunit